MRAAGGRGAAREPPSPRGPAGASSGAEPGAARRARAAQERRRRPGRGASPRPARFPGGRQSPRRPVFEGLSNAGLGVFPFVFCFLVFCFVLFFPKILLRRTENHAFLSFSEILAAACSEEARDGARAPRAEPGRRPRARILVCVLAAAAARCAGPGRRGADCPPRVDGARPHQRGLGRGGGTMAARVPGELGGRPGPWPVAWRWSCRRPPAEGSSCLTRTPCPPPPASRRAPAPSSGLCGAGQGGRGRRPCGAPAAPPPRSLTLVSNRGASYRGNVT